MADLDSQKVKMKAKVSYISPLFLSVYLACVDLNYLLILTFIANAGYHEKSVERKRD